MISSSHLHRCVNTTVGLYSQRARPQSQDRTGTLGPGELQFLFYNFPGKMRQASWQGHHLYDCRLASSPRICITIIFSIIQNSKIIKLYIYIYMNTLQHVLANICRSSLFMFQSLSDRIIHTCVDSKAAC